ncbi:hypothetical protein Lser_V15G15760 [Lactuca serriola]
MDLTEEIENNGGIWALEQKIDQPMDKEAGSTGLEEEEKNIVETRKRKFFAEILNAIRELQLQVQASQKRRKQRNDVVQFLLFFLGEQGTDEGPDLEEDEQLAMAIQESLNINMNSPPRNNHGSMICAGCNGEIGHGRFLSCMGGVWHPECFRCHACNIPISDYEMFPCLTTVRSTNHAIKNILTQNEMFAITFKDVGLVKELMDDCLTSQLSNSLRLHDVVSALGPMYEGHDNNGCKKLQSQINHLEGTKMCILSSVVDKCLRLLGFESAAPCDTSCKLNYLSSAYGRLVISSDGVWDALSTESALECSRGLAPESAAAQIVKGLS